MEQDPLKLGLAFEWCDGGTLADEIQGSAPARNSKGFGRAKQILCEILLGLTFLHGKQLVHRDVKPENILVFHLINRKRLVRICYICSISCLAH